MYDIIIIMIIIIVDLFIYLPITDVHMLILFSCLFSPSPSPSPLCSFPLALSILALVRNVPCLILSYQYALRTSYEASNKDGHCPVRSCSQYPVLVTQLSY